MAGLAAALAARGVSTTYVAEQTLTPDRAALGWELPGLGAAELVFAPDPQTVDEMAARADADSIHICQGLRANALVGLAQKALRERGFKQWVVMETVDDGGWRGYARRFIYRDLIHRRRGAFSGYLATGASTPAWLVARGALPQTVYPFTYFLPEPVVPPFAAVDADRPFRLIFVGQLIERKRLDLLIEAARALEGRSFELVVVGAGALEGSLHNLALDKLGRHLVWIGRQPQSAVPALMAAADCLVLPSRFDGWGAVATEALLMGTPVISSDGCGCAEVVRLSGVGGVFVRDDGAALSRLLTEVVAAGRLSSARRAALAHWARGLGAAAGAEYLERILTHDRQARVKPIPPWLAA